MKLSEIILTILIIGVPVYIYMSSKSGVGNNTIDAIVIKIKSIFGGLSNSIPNYRVNDSAISSVNYANVGGNTATLLEGKVIQYGKTLDVYNKPENLTSAKVFSDPPMNIAEIIKTGDTFKLADNNVQWKSNVQIKDGKYKIGIRPHNITTYKEGSNSVEINGKVLISELSGSESLIHFTNGNLNWVSLSNGIQQKNIGEDTKLHMNVNEFLYFDQNNRLVNHG